MIWLYSVLGLSGLAGVAYAIYQIGQWANADLKKEIAEKDLEAMRDAKDIERRINDNYTYRKRVRDKYR